MPKYEHSQQLEREDILFRFENFWLENTATINNFDALSREMLEILELNSLSNDSKARTIAAMIQAWRYVFEDEDYIIINKDIDNHLINSIQRNLPDPFEYLFLRMRKLSYIHSFLIMEARLKFFFWIKDNLKELSDDEYRTYSYKQSLLSLINIYTHITNNLMALYNDIL